MRATDLLEPNNLRLVFAAGDMTRDVVDDLAFLRTVWRALVAKRPRRFGGEPVFTPPRPWSALRGLRVGVVGTGGSGAMAALTGVQRALEEAGIEAQALAASSGSMLFAAPWAAGLDAEEAARFWLSLGDGDYLDPDWRALARALPRRLARFGGLLRGEAIERAFERRFGPLPLGETRIPLSTVAWNTDLNRVETLGTRETPELTLARATRVAISIPIMVEPVALDGHLYADGGIVDIFPVRALGDGPFDVIIGVNCYYPEGFAGEDKTGWRERSWSILRASGQLRYAVHLELARAQARLAGDKLLLLHPIPYAEARGARFYEHFLDRSSWPAFMRAGHACARAALERLARGAPAKSAARAQSLPPSEPLAAADASWLRMEEPDNPMTITALLRFDAPPDFERVREVVGERLLLHDRFRQRVADRDWKPDLGFELDAHLHRVVLPGGDGELAEFVGALAGEPLDRRRPLWQVQVVDGLTDGSGAVIARLGHAIGDGSALVRLLLSLLDPLGVPVDPPPLRPPSPSLRVASLGRRLRQGGAAARTLAHLALLHDQPNALQGPLGKEKRVAWSAPVSLDTLRRIARPVLATVNDVVLTAAAGALGRWLRARGPVLDELHAIVPVDLRVVEPDRLGNQFGLVFVPLAVEIEDPWERLKAARRAMDELKRSPEAPLAFDLLRAAARLGAGVEHKLVRFFGGKATLVLTNVRGPELPLALAGRRLRSVVIWAPQSGRVGLGLSVFSYAGELRLGVSADAHLVPDPGEIARHFVGEIERLCTPPLLTHEGGSPCVS